MAVEYILLIMITGFGALHGILLGISLLFNHQNQLSNKLLGVLLLFLGIRISKSIFLSFTSDLQFVFITTGLSLVLLFGPLFFLYVKSLLNENLSIRKIDFLHFLPFIFFFSFSLFQLLSVYFYAYFGIYFIYVQFFCYLLWTYKIKQDFLKIPENSIAISAVKRKWMNYTLIGMFFIWLSYFMFLLDEIVPYIAGPITYSLVVYPLSLWAFKNKPTIDHKKYQNSSISSQESSIVYDKLLQYMEADKPYLETGLKLPSLAQHLKTTPHILSQVINEKFQGNFQQFINSYRIKEAQEKLKDPALENLKIASIAFDCGFNSLSVFNTAFKKQHQMTPSQYREAYKLSIKP